jgi:septal ring factor EnvC (AmiA/AmiB activator)
MFIFTNAIHLHARQRPRKHSVFNGIKSAPIAPSPSPSFMTKILLGISVLLALASAILGFMTKGKVDNLQGEKKALVERTDQAEAATKKVQGELKVATEEATQAKAAAEEKEKQLADERTKVSSLNGQLATLNTQIEEKNAEITRLNEKIASTPAPAPGEAPAPAPNVTEQQLKDAQAKLAELQTLNDTLTNKAAEAENRARDLEQRERARQAGLTRPGVEATVQAVNQAWNFVVIDKGDRHGIAPNSQMIVKRGNEMIARLRVTSVEPSTSVADIIPGSLAKGAFIRPGDTVIFSGGT